MGVIGEIALAIVCGALANELFAWGPSLSELLLKVAVDWMPPELRKRIREEWRAHLDDLPGGLSKLTAAAGFLLSAFKINVRIRTSRVRLRAESRQGIEPRLFVSYSSDNSGEMDRLLVS